MNILNKIKAICLLIKQRWNADSPAFFVRLKNAALSIGGSGIAVLTLNTTLALNLPIGLITAIGYIIAVCAAVAGTSQLTKTP